MAVKVHVEVLQVVMHVFTMKMVTATSSNMLVSYCNTTECYNPKDLNLNLTRSIFVKIL